VPCLPSGEEGYGENIIPEAVSQEERNQKH
jgi:hypothetical protein